MKFIYSVAFLLLAMGCAETKVSGGTGNPLSPLGGSNQTSGNASSKPYMSEIIRRYGTPGDATQPFGLWNSIQTFTSEDGLTVLDFFMRITKDSVSTIAVCMNNETKKYVLAPTMAAVALKKNSDGSYSFTIPRFLETETESNGITCRSYLRDTATVIKVDERGMLLIKGANDAQFGELQRVK